MYQIIHTAKIVKCDETAEVGILVDGQVLPVGGEAGALGGGGGIAGKTRIYGDRFDKYLYHDEDLTKKMSAAELDALMNSTGVLVLVPGENSDTLVFPVSYRFNADIGCRLGLWQDGSVYLFMTKEAASGPM